MASNRVPSEAVNNLLETWESNYFNLNRRTKHSGAEVVRHVNLRRAGVSIATTRGGKWWKPP